MLPEYFAVVGAIIASMGGLYYAYCTIIGKVQPNRVTWVLWWILPTITFIAQRAQGVETLSWTTLISSLPPLFVVIASFLNKKAYWKTQPLDYVLMAIALVGILLWFFTKDPNIAILFAIVADVFAGLPTVIKALKHPETESWIAFAIGAFGFGICILAIHTFNFQNLAFVVYLVAMDALIAILALRKPKTHEVLLV